jgi:hypothetical protein
MNSLKINYKSNSSEMCKIGKKYGKYIEECYEKNKDNHIY